MSIKLAPALRFRLRRTFRRFARQARETFTYVLTQLDTNFIGRLNRFGRAKRFTLGWLLLCIVIIGTTGFQTVLIGNAYQSPQPVSGGVYREGIIGGFSTANPLYATGAVDTAVSKLVFDGLFTYDANNQLAPDLASSYETNDTGKVYTVHLKKNIFWHDGQPITADDVVFTFKTIQNPDAHSVLQSSMQGVTIAKVDTHTVTFTLQSALGSFPTSLTVGLVPKHILANVPAVSLRNHPFNTLSPVGSGPFSWQQLVLAKTGDTGGHSATISLSRFATYHDGAPQLDQFVVEVYDSADLMQRAFLRRDINAMAGLKAVPQSIEQTSGVKVYDFQTTAASMVFFNTQSEILSNTDVRRALLYGTDRRQIVHALSKTLRIVREPVLIGTFAFDPQFATSLHDEKKAVATLDAAGWKLEAGSKTRTKDGKKLIIRIYAEDTPDNQIITNELKSQWQEVGVELIPTLLPSIYLQTNISTRSYDALLYSISIGTDPDVYAYWHSSQATATGMNFSNYKSSVADKALEAGRTRQDPAQRALKYKPFLKAWSEDVPAISLFRPRMYYVSRGEVYGLKQTTLNTDIDRYNTVSQWQIVTKMVNDN